MHNEREIYNLKFKMKKALKVIPFLGIFIIITSALKKQWELKENAIEVEGVITKYYKIGQKRYLKYEFLVEGKVYSGEVRVNGFKCSDGAEGCLGKKFIVRYSSINPENNDIDIGVYNRYKLTKRLF